MPAPPKLSAEEFVHEFNTLGPYKLARKHNISSQAVFRRRRVLERKGHILKGPTAIPRTSYPWEIALNIADGTVLVGSDAHYPPGPPSLMHRAFVAFCKEYKPIAVVMNGDVIDAPTISKYAPIGWEKRPSLADEIEVAKERLGEIEAAAFKAQKIWPLGNHDERFESRIATIAPEYAKIHGVHLHDHFPNWQSCWNCLINDDVIIKHLFKGGQHGPFNSTLWSGKNIILGHRHDAHVRPLDDLRGTRYGVDTGCIADTDARTFVDYTRGSPKNWRSGFCVLTFREGRLLQPELVLKWGDEQVQFRGEVIAP